MKKKFPVAQKVKDLKFLIGLFTNLISKINLKLIHNTFYEIDKL